MKQIKNIIAVASRIILVLILSSSSVWATHGYGTGKYYRNIKELIDGSKYIVIGEISNIEIREDKLKYARLATKDIIKGNKEYKGKYLMYGDPKYKYNTSGLMNYKIGLSYILFLDCEGSYCKLSDPQTDRLYTIFNDNGVYNYDGKRVKVNIFIEEIKSIINK